MDMLLNDLDSFSEGSSYEDQDGSEFMYGGQAHCIFSSLQETIGKIDDFLSFERVFMPGDVVCLITDPSGQMGRVINVDMIVDLENALGNKIKDVNSEELKKIHSISVGDYVVQGPWLGKVDKIIDHVTVMFDDGTKCEFTMIDPEMLVPISPDWLEDAQYPYYPGQRVQVKLSSSSKSARWLCGTQKGKQDEGTVCAVDAGLVYVDWLGCALVGREGVPAPPHLQDSKTLTLLSSFSHANWQLGDWCMFPIPDYRSMEYFCFNASNFGLIKGHQQCEHKFQKGNHGSNFQEVFVIVKTKTKVDVLWQDGSQSLGLEAQALYPVNIIDAHDFWPEQFVLAKETCDDLYVPTNNRWGVVRCVDSKERTVKVEWKTFAMRQATDLGGGPMEETMSAYELVEHPHYSFCIGDVVFRLQNRHFVDPADHQIDVINTSGMDEEVDNKVKDCGGRDQNEYLCSNYLFHIGIVIGFIDGDIEVKWAAGLKTKVAPYEILRMDKFEGSSATSEFNDESVEDFNEEIRQHSIQLLCQKRKDLLDFGCDGKDSSSFSLPRVVIGFFTRITSSLFGSLGSISLSDVSDPKSKEGKITGIPREEEEILELCNFSTEEPSLGVGSLQTLGETNSEEKVKEPLENEDCQFLSQNKYPKQFKQFDMISDCSDHHFVDAASKGSSQVKRGWLKKIQQEWSILQKDLPETIYVRVYEDRMDLLRVAIMGSPGTPYHDNLFFFDFFLPPEYSHEPPLVHYISGGLRINPNLYESGRVCLSLLNTWSGTGSEVWNPGSSTILQILLSLQALVLNEKPYFNEAGYDTQVGRAEGERNSETYNENAFLVSCRSMLYLLHRPPKHFDALVEEHFSQHCKDIMSACKAYMEGAPVGCAYMHGKMERENQKGNSTGFKIMLSKLFPKLLEAFSSKGIDCSQFVGPEL